MKLLMGIKIHEIFCGFISHRRRCCRVGNSSLQRQKVSREKKVRKFIAQQNVTRLLIISVLCLFILFYYIFLTSLMDMCKLPFPPNVLINFHSR